MRKIEKLAKSKIFIRPENHDLSYKSIVFQAYRLGFLTLNNRLAMFTKFRQVFFKALIFHHFDLEYHIWIEIDIFGYIIDGVLYQLTSNDLIEWYL